MQMVTVELAHRLFERGILGREELGSALHDASMRGVALFQVLVERIPGFLGRFESEFGAGEPAATTFEPDRALCARLPLGMCERLLAVPLPFDTTAHAVPLAVVDPFDPHVPAEFSHHLGLRVRRVRATFHGVIEALGALRPPQIDARDRHVFPDAAEDRTPAFGTRVPRQLGTELTRRSHARGMSVPPVYAPSQSEPPIPLVRQRARSESTSTSGSFDAVRPSALPELTELMEQVEAAPSPRALLERLCGAVTLLAARQALFALKAGKFELQLAGSNPVVIDEAEPSFLLSACQAGYFFGPLPRSDRYAPLAEVMGIAMGEEVYAVPIQARGKVVLVVVVARLVDSFSATRQLDRLVAAASNALERILKDRRSPN